jgi:ParB-like chromosome segregation protein Spo0J
MREGLMYHGLIDAQQVKLNTASKRRITIKKLQDLKDSIQSLPEMMYLRPIVLNKDNLILGGNMRFRAAVDLGFKEIPFIRIEDLTQEQELEFIMKDNAHWGDAPIPQFELPKYEVKEGKQRTIKITTTIDEHDFILRDLTHIQSKLGLHDHSQALRLVIDHFLTHNYI